MQIRESIEIMLPAFLKLPWSVSVQVTPAGEPEAWAKR